MKFKTGFLYLIIFLCSTLFSKVNSMNLSKVVKRKTKICSLEQLIKTNELLKKRKCTGELLESRENLFEKNKEYFEATGSIEVIAKDALEKLKEKYLLKSLKNEEDIEITKLLLNVGTDSIGLYTAIGYRNLKAFFLLYEFGVYDYGTMQILRYTWRSGSLDKYSDNEKEVVMKMIKDKVRNNIEIVFNARKKCIENFLIPVLAQIVVDYASEYYEREDRFDNIDLYEQISKDCALITRNKLKIQKIDNKDLFQIIFKWISKKRSEEAQKKRNFDLTYSL